MKLIRYYASFFSRHFFFALSEKYFSAPDPRKKQWNPTASFELKLDF